MHELENEYTNTIYISSEDFVENNIEELSIVEIPYELDEGSSLVYGIIGVIIGGLFSLSNPYLGGGIVTASVWFIPGIRNLVLRKLKFINRKTGSLIILGFLSLGLIQSFDNTNSSSTQASVAGVNEKTEELSFPATKAELKTKEAKIKELQTQLNQYLGE